MHDVRQWAVTTLAGLTCALVAPLLGLIIAQAFGLYDADEPVAAGFRCAVAQACLDPADGLDSHARESCAGEGRRVCIAPLGSISADLVRRLVDYYDETYGLEVGVLTPSSLPESIIDPDRQQIESKDIGFHISQMFPLDHDDPETVVIGLMPVDLYIEERNWRFAFGATWPDQFSLGIISTVRMNPATFGLPNDDLYYDRVRTLVSKYIGLMYYDLPLSPDPMSPMYNNILSVDDLDRMGDDLPIE